MLRRFTQPECGDFPAAGHSRSVWKTSDCVNLRSNQDHQGSNLKTWYPFVRLVGVLLLPSDYPFWTAVLVNNVRFAPCECYAGRPGHLAQEYASQEQKAGAKWVCFHRGYQHTTIYEHILLRFSSFISIFYCRYRMLVWRDGGGRTAA